MHRQKNERSVACDRTGGPMFALLLALAAIAIVVVGRPALAADTTPIEGEWFGEYSCRAVPGQLRLTLQRAETGLLEGEMRFGPREGKAAAAYRVRGRYLAETRAFRLLPGDWIDRPSGWDAGGVDGTVHENGLTLQGAFRGCAGGDEEVAFSARRSDATGDGDGGIVVAADDPLALDAGAFEARWVGTVSCGDHAPIDLTIDAVQDRETVAARVRLYAGSDDEITGFAWGEVQEGRLLLRKSAAQLSSRGTTRDFEALSFAEPEGDRLQGSVESGFPVGWDCTGLSLERAGPPEQPSSARLAELVGTWSGFQARGAEENLFYLNRGRQVRLVIAENGGRFQGLYALASPVNVPPAEQQRYTVALRALSSTEDGRLVFASTSVIRAEGGYKDWLGRKDEALSLLLLSLEGGDRLEVESIGDPSGGGAFSLSRASSDEVARLAVGEGPPLPMPEAFAGAMGAAASLDEQCRVLKDWAEPFVRAREARRMRRSEQSEASLALFQEGRFEEAFGVPYGLTTDDERKLIGRLLRGRACDQRLGLDYGHFGSTIEYAFNNSDAVEDILGRLSDRRDTSRWFDQAMAEIEAMPAEGAAEARLDELSEEADARSDEIGAEDRSDMERAVTEKRHAIAVAKFNTEVLSVPELPETRATLGTLSAMLDEARSLGLPANDAERASRLAREKTRRIVDPIFSAALSRAQDLPHSLAGLEEATRTERDLAALVGELAVPLADPADREALSTVRRIRRAMIEEPDIQEAVRARLAAASPGAGDPARGIRALAGRYIDVADYSGADAIPAYRQAVSDAIAELEIRSIDFADRSTSDPAGAPSAREMLLAVKSGFDRINAQFSADIQRCRGGGFKNDPLMALKCVTILGQMGQEDLKIRMTRFEKIGCARGVGRTGFICDYVVGFASNSPYAQGELGRLTGQGSVGQGRFVPTSGGWLFTRLR